MIRRVIENLLLFLLPTLIYLAWMLWKRSKEEDGPDPKKPVITLLDDAPLLWLFVAGALLVIVTLATFGTYSGGKPGQQYVPGVLRDGKIEPGQIQ